mgnify:CR=1 FL=1
MKRLLLILFALVVIIPASNSASAQEEGDFRFGFRTGYYFRTNAFVIGAYGNYGITNWLNVEPGISYVCKEKSTVDVYCDFQIPLEIATYWHVYPIVGLSINDISEKSGTIDGWAGGLNIGLGTTYNLNGHWNISAQGKWMGRFPREHTSAVIIAVGIDYNF